MSNQLDPNMPGLFAIMAEEIAQERLDYTHPNDLKPGIMERYMEKCEEQIETKQKRNKMTEEIGPYDPSIYYRFSDLKVEDFKPRVGVMERYMEKCGKPTDIDNILKQPLEPVSLIGDVSQTPIKPQNALLRYFEYSHLPQKLQEISKPICELALKMDEVLPEGSEKTAGLRKLLEVKDCFVRANLG